MTNSDTPPPLYTQNPLERFSQRAQDYANYRPSYPKEAIDLILQGLQHPSQLTIADIGAGTGISAHLMANRGTKVWAIEPNAAMREVACSHPLIEFLDTTAEQTGLPTQSVDVVLCCQSFHWFDQSAALAEFHRILKPTGRVAIMWNDRNLNDPLTQAYSDILRQAADRQVFDCYDRKSALALKNSPLFTRFRTHALVHSHPLTLEGLVGLALSASYIPKQGIAYEQLITNVQSFHHHWSNLSNGGWVELSYRADLYVADRHP